MKDRSRLRFAILALAASLALSGIARAQVEPQQESPSSEATANSRVFQLALTRSLDPSGTAEFGTRFGTIPPVFGPGRLSSEGPSGSRFGVVNPNAPWKAGGGFSYSAANGTVLRAGFYGYANSRVPLFMNQTIGGGEDLTLPLVSFTDLSQQQVQWVLTAGVEKTFVTFPGLAIGGVADGVIPLNTVTPPTMTPQKREEKSDKDPDTQKRAPPMIRGGIKVGF